MYKFLLFSFLIGFFACDNRPAAHDTGELKELEAPNAADPSFVPALLNSMQGKWKSTEDAKNVIEIQDNTFISYYDGEEISREELQVFTPCQGDCANGQDLGDANCFQTKGEMDTNCYAIINIDPQTLEYSLLGGTGNTLRFTRVEE